MGILNWFMRPKKKEERSFVSTRERVDASWGKPSHPYNEVSVDVRNQINDLRAAQQQRMTFSMNGDARLAQYIPADNAQQLRQAMNNFAEHQKIPAVENSAVDVKELADKAAEFRDKVKKTVISNIIRDIKVCATLGQNNYSLNVGQDLKEDVVSALKDKGFAVTDGGTTMGTIKITW